VTSTVTPTTTPPTTTAATAAAEPDANQVAIHEDYGRGNGYVARDSDRNGNFDEVLDEERRPRV
jgi:hypothetical protein